MQLSRIGPFALEEALDGDVDSNVVRGVHVERKMSMAIKFLPKNVGQQLMGSNTFSQDVKALQKLIHPGIVRYYGGAVEEGQPYLALELIQGESLRQRLDHLGRLPWEMMVDVADDIAQALAHAHAKGFVHQRLTPTRVLLPESGGVKLIGYDCVWADRDDVLGLRSPMKVAHYLAPEEFRGKQSATLPPCDLFSLGVILYECLAGEPPWPAETPADLVQARRKAVAPRVSSKVLDCPVWLDVLVSKLLTTKRTERLASTEETHRAIVSAKQKVASGMGAAQHAWSGRQGALTIDQDRSELRKIKNRRPKKRDASPFYEKVWFLAACLVGVIGIGAWVLSPLNEDELFAKAKPLMESDRAPDWKRAEEQYLKPLLERFPETKYAAEIQAFDERYTMHRAENRVRNNERLRRDSQSEAERRYGEAWRHEQLGDRLTAWQKYDALVNLFQDSDDVYDQAYVNLSERQIKQIKSDQAPRENASEFVQKQLERAESLAKEGQLIEARRVLDSVVALYEGNRELQPLVNRAREQIRRIDAQQNDGG